MSGNGSTPRRAALVVGNSDGIGLALTRRLLAEGWMVTGISRSPGRVDGEPTYRHVELDVGSASYLVDLSAVCEEIGVIDLCVYCAGVGEGFQIDDLAPQRRVFEVNLLGAVGTAEVVVERMLAAGAGHFIGLSSLADDVIAAESPGYSASKAGLSSYLRGLALALRPRGIHITNVRFGFVDTKMAKAPMRPMMISADKAAGVLMWCVRKRPIQLSYPKRMALIVGVLRRLGMVRVWFG